MTNPSSPRRILRVGIVLSAVLGVAAILLATRDGGAQVEEKQPPQAVPVSVAVVETRNVTLWDEFSGHLEAVDRVDIRSRVAGAVQTVHFREGSLVKQGDLLVTIDPAPYAAEVEHAKSQLTAADARLSIAEKERDRAQRLRRTGTGAISESTVDQRVSAYREAAANLETARATLQSAQLNLDYTQIRAPITGRVGKLEITVGNLIAAGSSGPLLTTMVSVDPIYASFNADEDVVIRALSELGDRAHSKVERIPVVMTTTANPDTPVHGKLQLIDNQIDTRSGTVRVRAVFTNADGNLMPGQFARLRMAHATAKPAMLVSERAVGTDQNKKFVMVIGDDSKAAYREVTLGASVDDLRVVTHGLKPGERIVVNGLQRVRPGVLVAPEPVAMNARPEQQAGASATSNAVVER